MPRWNNNLESNTKEVMDIFIKNIHTKLYNQLLQEVLTLNLENNKKIIEIFLREKLQLFNKLARHTSGYWLSRGWSTEESYIKSKENKQKNTKSAYSQKTWLDRINPVTGVHYTLEEADFERNSRRPIRKEYWIKQGHTEPDAIKLATDTKNKNNKCGRDKSNASTVRRITSKRCIDYYTVRGYSQEEAVSLVSQNQKHFSKEICIEKYGEEVGVAIWQDRQDQWQSKLNAKSDKEKARINKLKLFKGGSISKGETLLVENIRARGINCNGQFEMLREKTKYYVYDIVYNKKIIEYNGDFWHANPKKYKPNDILKFPNSPKVAQEIWDADERKIQFARDQGYEVLVVWESDFKKDKEEIIKQCIQFLTQ
jgi:G:T-mismatch repair DNA endonuclease (very short patch repair protein)